MARRRREYEKWRRKVMEHYHCDESAVESAVADGVILLAKMREAQNPLYHAYTEMPAYEAAFICWIYAQNPLLKLLMTQRPGDATKSPYTEPCA